MGRFRNRPGMATLSLAALLLPGCQSLTPRPLVSEYEPFARATPAVADGRLRARFLGTSTIAITDGDTTIMTDGFFSRPSIARLFLGAVRPNRLRIEHALLKAGLTRVDAIFVAQSHHDHAMDTAYVAHLTGARIIGSSSTVNIALGSDFKGEIEALGHRSIHKVGLFEVTAFQTPHSSPTPFPGKNTGKLSPYAGVEDYREGGNFSFLVNHPRGRILIVPSRGCREGQFQGVTADVVFLGVGGLFTKPGLMKDHWRESVVRTGARLVIPIHWDNFFRPLHKRMDSLMPGSIEKREALLIALAAEAPPEADIRVERVPDWKEIDLRGIERTARPKDLPLPARPRRCGESRFSDDFNRRPPSR
jgi:L-ascorbate metabolism protein UlaG (beta-lactamase superfamily)